MSRCLHLLCFFSTEMELLHLLDEQGVPLTNFASLTDGHNAAFLQYCLSGLLIQEVNKTHEVLPL